MEQNIDESASDDSVAPKTDEIEDLKIKNAELMDNWKRAAAELENFKRRKEQETKGLLEFAKETTVMNLMPSLQSLEQVLKYAPSDDKYKDWLDGLKATIQQLEKAMEELGVKKIKAVGLPFDPEIHEAVEEDEQADDGVVAKEIQPGFTLNGHVIIAAKVAVGKKK